MVESGAYAGAAAGRALPPAAGVFMAGALDPAFARFVGLIAAATFVPMAAMPVLARFHPTADSIVWMTGLLHFLGGPAHVAATGWFFSEPPARAHFRDHPARYVVVPLLLVVMSTIIVGAWPTSVVTSYFVTAYWAWQVYHYQRQNWGILALVSRATTGERASETEGWALRLAVVAGIVASTYSINIGHGTIFAEHRALLFRVGIALYAAAGLLAAIAIVRYPALRRSPLRVACLLVGTGFYLPAFVFRDMPSAFFSYALAHGLQYFVFMGHLVAKPADRPVASQLIRLLAWTLALGCLLAMGGDLGLTTEVRWLFGLNLGVTMAHFVIDAGIWRMSEPFPRAYIGPAFRFGTPSGATSRAAG
jgi:hypothetical protein